MSSGWDKPWEGEKEAFNIQWHLTADCPNRCKHCYVDPNCRTLSLETNKKIVNDLEVTLKEWDKIGRIFFTGGDPLLYPYFFDLLGYVRSQIPDAEIGILGNPELLTDKVIDKLKELKVSSYQMSIDGLESTHDYIRHKGSFRNTLEKADLLKDANMGVVLRSTVHKLNINEIPKVVDVIAERDLDLFSFHRIIPIGSGKNMGPMVSPNEYRNFLLQMFEKSLEYGGNHFSIAAREPLVALLRSEIGLTIDRNENGFIFHRCVSPELHCISHEGTALTCRMLLIPVGKVPDLKIKDIYATSPELEMMRKVERIEKCGECELLSYCGGCRAMAHSMYGNYFAPDPLCWKES